MCPCCPDCNISSSPCQDALGSNAEAVGSIAGRVDALFGAVEAQKTTGSLHFHFFMFVQRLHQFATLKEIADRITEGLVNATELKHFLGQICCESYPDANQFLQERDSLEKNFPAYSESSECSGPPMRGGLKLGRMPRFLYDDARTALHSSPCGHNEQAAKLCGGDGGEAFRYEFARALQYFMSRCQHHIHRMVIDPKTKQERRLVPNPCASKKKQEGVQTRGTVDQQGVH